MSWLLLTAHRGRLSVFGIPYLLSAFSVLPVASVDNSLWTSFYYTAGLDEEISSWRVFAVSSPLAPENHQLLAC